MHSTRLAAVHFALTFLQTLLMRHDIPLNVLSHHNAQLTNRLFAWSCMFLSSNFSIELENNCKTFFRQKAIFKLYSNVVHILITRVEWVQTNTWRLLYTVITFNLKKNWAVSFRHLNVCALTEFMSLFLICVESQYENAKLTPQKG